MPSSAGQVLNHQEEPLKTILPKEDQIADNIVQHQELCDIPDVAEEGTI